MVLLLYVALLHGCWFFFWKLYTMANGCDCEIVRAFYTH